MKHPEDAEPVHLRTGRLLLRAWQPSDLAPFAALNADPEVMRYFPAPLAREESDALARRLGEAVDRRGWGLWAVEAAADGRFIGFAGLSPVHFDAHFTPAVEVGWRLARAAWGLGFATEAAEAALAFAAHDLGLQEVVSFTAAGNARSRAVMERLHMTHDSHDDFDHPKLRQDHHLARHVLYRTSGPHPARPGVTPSPACEECEET